MKLECCHADTCLPSYWSGHHRPHIQIPVRKGMLFKDMISALHSELNEGALMGSDVGDDCWSDSEEGEAWYDAAHAAIDAIALNDETKEDAQNEPLFLDLEEDEDEDCSESVYAFFVFMELEP